ncbi:MAG: hypothetical protein ACLR78_10305 [Roseburia sp.]
MSKFKKLVSQPLFLPIFCMILVMAVNIIYDVMAGNFAFNFLPSPSATGYCTDASLIF